MKKSINKKNKPTAKEIKEIQDIIISIRNDPKAMKQAHKLIVCCS